MKTERQRAIEANRQAATQALRQLATAIEEGQINEINVTWNQWGTRTMCFYTVPIHADDFMPITIAVKDADGLSEQPRTEGHYFISGKILEAETAAEVRHAMRWIRSNGGLAEDEMSDLRRLASAKIGVLGIAAPKAKFEFEDGTKGPGPKKAGEEK